MKEHSSVLFSTVESEYLASGIANNLGIALYSLSRRKFSDGEKYLRIPIKQPTDLAGKDAIIVGSTHTDEALLELYRLGSTLAELGTKRRIFVIPFFGYSTMDRAINPGEVVTAKANCRLLSSIPISGSSNIFLFLDLHEPSLVHYFEGNATAIDLSATSLLSDPILTLTSNTFVLASADLGMPRQVLSLAKTLNADVALVSKARTFDQTKAIACIGDIKGKNVVIYDDMVRTGGSLINAAEVYKKEGAEHIYALISHFACVSEEAFKKLMSSPIETIITTNTHPTSQQTYVQTSSFVKVLDASPIFSQAIKQFMLSSSPSSPSEAAKRSWDKGEKKGGVLPMYTPSYSPFERGKE